MARRQRSPRLQTKESRRALAVAHAPYWHEVRPLLHIGFRKGRRANTWLLRENINGKQHKRRLGIADDENVDADHITVLSFEDALKIATSGDRPTAGLVPRYTVNAALTAYWAVRRARSPKYAIENDMTNMAAFVIPKFGETDIAELSREKLQAWRDSLVKETDDLEVKRKSQLYANRIRTTFFAALNLAYNNERITGTPWRRVPPFRNVDRARKRSLTAAEAVKVLNACEPDFRELARGGLYTGLRLGELRALTAADFIDERVHVQNSKTGASRSVPLNDEGIRFFEAAVAGKAGTDFVFLRSDGDPWSRNIYASRRVKRACKRVGIAPTNFQDFRRTYATLLINKKTRPEVIQKLLGHADLRMTMRTYAHLLDENVTQAVEQNLPSFGLASPKKRKPRR
jgi:integrase